MTLLCRMHGGTPIPAILHAPLVLHKQPHRLCVSADDLLPAGCQCCTAAFCGGRASEGLARSGRPGGSRLSAGRSPRCGRGVSGNSSGSPSALLWPSEWGPHCFCRPDLTHGADSSGCASLVRLQGVCCCLPPRRPALKVCLAAKEGHSGLRLALQGPATVSLVPELAPAGPARGQVVGMRWLRAWATSRLRRTAGRAERGLARHLASLCGPGRTR